MKVLGAEQKRELKAKRTLIKEARYPNNSAKKSLNQLLFKKCSAKLLIRSNRVILRNILFI